MKRTLTFALLVACSEGPPAAEGGSSSTAAASTESSSSSGTSDTSSGAVDESSSSGGRMCEGPFMFGPPTAWERYGLDANNSRYNEAERAIDPSSVACLQPRWQVDDLAGVTSTPAVVGGVVYFGDWGGLVHARDVVDGTPRWTTDVAAQVNDSPLVTTDRVFVGDDDGWLHALDRETGEVIWRVELDAHPNAGIFSSPILAGDRLVIGVASIELSETLDDYTFRGSVVALDPDDGTELWRRYTTTDDAQAGAGVSVWSSAAYDEERAILYIGTGNTYEPPASPLSDSVLALELATGAIVWSRQFTEDDVYTIFMQQPQGPDADIGAAPNLFTIGDRDVLGVGDKAGVYAVLDRDDGETVWAVQLTEGSHLGGVMTTAAVGDGTIWVASNEWATSIFEFDDPANHSSMFALSAEDGTQLWQRPLPFPAFGATTWAGGVVFQGTIDGTVHALDAATGVELWSVMPGGDIGGGFSVVDGTLYVGHGFWFFTEPTMNHGGFVAYGLPG
ncbi:MAG TPA: PQQ-binding-like beta-propeller repeat protein [Nannocystaceae bacterium]|nr:PQQ-binding-like beta-propeller repeat protein [Nannocystaceae bacterium]